MQRPAAAAALALLLLCGLEHRASASSDWFQGPNGNLAVVTAGDDQLYTAAIPDGSGGAIVAWHDYRNGATTGFDIYAQHILGSGVIDPTWPSQGLALTTAADQQQYPTLCTDGAGGAYVAWVGGNLSSIYAQHVLITGTVDPAWTAGGDAVCTVFGTKLGCKIASDGAGGAFLTWDDRRAGARRAYVAHLIASGVDNTWDVDGTRACLAEGQSFPVICSDGAGGAFVAWDDFRIAGNTDIYATHMLSNGTRTWPDAGVPVCLAAGTQRLNGSGTAAVTILTFTEAQANAIAPDGAGGFIVTWTDQRTLATTGVDVYAQRMTGSTNPAAGWPIDGLAICTAAGDQSLPNLLTDGAGGATLMWTDARPGAFAQHVTGAGAVDGPVNGLLVDAQGTGIPIGVKDASSGAILTYQRVESGSNNLYAQHLLTTPSFGIDPAWPVAGLAVSTASGNQVFGTVVRDNAGGAIAIWPDTRDSLTNGYDVYAQRVIATGTLPTGSTSVPHDLSANESLRIDPNPVTVGADVRFALATPSRVRIELYDVVGRKTLDILDGRQEAGEHVVHFTRSRGSLRDGVYYLRMFSQPAAGGPGALATRAVAAVH